MHGIKLLTITFNATWWPSDMVFIACLLSSNSSLSVEIKVFVKRLTMWLDSSLEDVPQTLRDKKLEGKNLEIFFDVYC